jgi:hypothetical protein
MSLGTDAAGPSISSPPSGAFKEHSGHKHRHKGHRRAHSRYGRQGFPRWLLFTVLAGAAAAFVVLDFFAH